jgi:putative nucleotidyltransferase with HDIG domain
MCARKDRTVIQLIIDTTEPSRPEPRTTRVEWIRSGEWLESQDITLPMLPARATEVMRLAMDPEVSASRIAAVVAKDQVLATLVLRLANSAFSAPASDISNVSDAVVRVGTRAVRNVVVASCLASRLKDPQIYGSHGPSLTDHSIGTAYLARSIAEWAGESPDEAFLYGLLHDIGKLLILKLARDASLRYGPPASNAEIDALIVEKHAEFGGYLLEQWKLPATLNDPVVWHHQPNRAEKDPHAAAVAYAANRLAHRYGFGCIPYGFDPLSDAVCASVGLDAERLEEMDARAPGLFEVARQIIR